MTGIIREKVVEANRYPRILRMKMTFDIRMDWRHASNLVLCRGQLVKDRDSVISVLKQTVQAGSSAPWFMAKIVSVFWNKDWTTWYRWYPRR